LGRKLSFSAPTVYGKSILFYINNCYINIFVFACQEFYYSDILAGFILTPGPIVDATVTLLKYCPLAAAGLALTIASINAAKFSANFSPPNDTFPTVTCIMLVLSNLYSTLP